MNSLPDGIPLSSLLTSRVAVVEAIKRAGINSRNIPGNFVNVISNSPRITLDEINRLANLNVWLYIQNRVLGFYKKDESITLDILFYSQQENGKIGEISVQSKITGKVIFFALFDRNSLYDEQYGNLEKYCEFVNTIMGM